MLFLFKNTVLSTESTLKLHGFQFKWAPQGTKTIISQHYLKPTFHSIPWKSFEVCGIHPHINRKGSWWVCWVLLISPISSPHIGDLRLLCLESCWHMTVLFTAEQCSHTESRLRLQNPTNISRMRVDKNLGGDTTRTTDPNWPKGCFIHLISKKS